MTSSTTAQGAPSDLLDLLHRFNRDDRSLLVRWVTGEVDRDVRLGSDFRRALAEALGEAVPEAPAVFTDYHLDWLYAALSLHAGTWTGEPTADRMFPRGALAASPDDVDLVVAWRTATLHRVVLVEAKAFAGFQSEVLQHKARRLGAIFGWSGARSPTSSRRSSSRRSSPVPGSTRAPGRRGCCAAPPGCSPRRSRSSSPCRPRSRGTCRSSGATGTAGPAEAVDSTGSTPPDQALSSLDRTEPGG